MKVAQMPWEKEFDVDEALESAMKVFWAKGYEATSISDLVEAMQINKGSLYNAFGSKKALFERALLKYDSDNSRSALRQLESIDDPILAIRTFFDGLIAESETDSERKGCLLVNTALELPNHEGDVSDMVTSGLNEVEQFLERMVRRAQERGKVSADLNPGDVAKSLFAQAVGLRVLARGVFDKNSLNAVRSQALEQISL